MSSSSHSATNSGFSLYQFFSPGGVLAKSHPAYEFRRGQLQMAQAVEEALEEKRHLIVEAGTGTGKTLAYLMPVIRSGKRVIISTGTKNLQEQLFFKDVPFLERVLFGNSTHERAQLKPGFGLSGEVRHLSVCYMKGRNNYLCRKKLYDLTDQPVLSGLEEIEHYQAIAAWEKTTHTGDRAELAELPETSALWPKLDARADSCIGQKCKEYERCFITEMRRRAAESDIIIVNHHLFFADLSIKLEADGAPDAGVLPDAGAVIFDEAHELEEVAGNYFGISVSNFRVEELARDTENLLQREKLYTPQISGAIHALRERSQLFFSLLPAQEGRFAFDTRREFLEENGEEFIALRQALVRLVAEFEQLPQKPDEVFSLARRAHQLEVQLGVVMENEDPNTVFWIERRGGRGVARAPSPAPWGARGGAGDANRSAVKGRGFSRAEKGDLGTGALAPDGRRTNVFLQATPIEAGSILRECLWSKLETAVLTSATLAVGGGFSYIRQRLGLDHARELIVPSHFDYESQAILYVPPALPDPRTPQFAAEAADVIRRLLEITRGRAFVLFTSYAQMHDIYDRLLGLIEFPMLKQGDAPKSALLEEFRLTPNAVLFGTSSFWQGVDVQGEQLSCVIIDRLPFAVPSDPIVAARVKAIDHGGGNAFNDYQVPSAVITLKQGFGRLIRSLHDRGLLALLDNRILKKSYGRVFVDSLPSYTKTTDLRKVEAFFGIESEK
ncbi:MAG TPA: ATP-dependent DNA helicase [Terriglobales bacterium]|nr:ATP-dependent DNA helicase [Terriglobales bacterium]